MSLQWTVLEPPMYGLDRVFVQRAEHAQYRFYIGHYANGLDDSLFVTCDDVMQDILCWLDHAATVREAKDYVRDFIADLQGSSRRSGHFNGESDLWGTPQAEFDKLNDEFGFTLDACATAENAKCARYFTPEQDGLQQDWSGEVVFMNPPFSQVGKWIAKAHDAAKVGATVVCIVLPSVNTRWWNRYIEGIAEVGLNPTITPPRAK
jgi:DNA N-6-adenine-methyltransferase (Dam)